MSTTINDLNHELMRLSRELSLACNRLEASAHEFALRENDYRKAKAMAFLTAEGKTVDAKKAQVDLHCESERLAAHLAEATKLASYERVRSLRASLSALQSIAASARVEMETLGLPDAISQPEPNDDFPF